MVLTNTESGSLKLQYRGDVNSDLFVRYLKAELTKLQYSTLNWPTLYFSTPEIRKKKFTSTVRYKTEDEVLNTPVKSVIEDEDLPWIL